MKTKTILFIIGAVLVLMMCSCSENYGNGKKFGTITKFSKEGLIFDTYEGHLNSTQTGMNSSGGIDFSIDRDNVPEGLVSKLDSAAEHGWIVELNYRQVKGWNWFSNRGNTNIFATDCKVMHRNVNEANIIKNTSDSLETIYPTSYNSTYRNDTLFVIILGADRKPISFENLIKQ